MQIMESAIASRDFSEIQVDDCAELSRTITDRDVNTFAELSGDLNPLHMVDGYAQALGFRSRVAHGMLVASYVSTLIGMRLPGIGGLWMQQTFRWHNPVFVGDTIHVRLRVTRKSEGTRIVAVTVRVVNQNHDLVIEGEGTVLVRHGASPNPPRQC